MPPSTRRHSGQEDHSELDLLVVAGVALNVAAREVEAHGKTHHLTPKECALLETLMNHAGKALRREFLMEEVWETTYTGDMRTLEVHISWLRGKVEQDRSNPQRIQTIRKVGYRFVGPGELQHGE